MVGDLELDFFRYFLVEGLIEVVADLVGGLVVEVLVVLAEDFQVVVGFLAGGEMFKEDN